MKPRDTFICQKRELRLETQGRFAGFHIEWHGVMLVRDRPLAADLAEANCCAPPHIERSSVCFCCAHVAETVGEGHVIACGDAEILNLVADGSLERSKPLLRAFSLGIRSNILQWVYYIKRQDVRSHIGHRYADIPCADCRYATVY